MIKRLYLEHMLGFKMQELCMHSDIHLMLHKLLNTYCCNWIPDPHLIHVSGGALFR